MNLPRMPRTAKGWYALVAREDWDVLLVSAQGGRAGGKRREYVPPPEIRTLIDRYQNPDSGRTDLSKSLRNTENKISICYVNVTLLARCLDAVDKILSRKSLKISSTTRRLDFAINAYSNLTSNTAIDPLDMMEFHKLQEDEFEAAATLALWDRHGNEAFEDDNEGDFIISSF